MIDFKRGILRIGDKQGFFGYVYDFTILAMLLSICFFNSGETINTLLHYAVFAVFCVVTAIDVVNKIIEFRKFIVPVSVIWYGLFFIFAISSYAWATNPDSVLARYKMIIEVFVVVFGTTCYLSSKERIYRFFNIVCVAITILAFVLLIRTPSHMWFDGFNDNDIIKGLNINTASQMMTVCGMICFYLAYVEQKKLYYIPMLFFVVMGLFSGSRKAVIMIALASVMILVLNVGKKKYFLNLCIVLGVVIAICIATLKIPTLYDVIGYRIESMLEHYLLGIESDNSLWLREMYIKKGWEYFYNSPILGNGLNNFGFLFKETGLYGGYAHNNFIEMLSGLGVVGFVTYYWFHSYLIISLGKMVLKRRKIAILGFTYMCVFTVFEYGIVSYYDRFLSMMVCMSFMILSLLKTEDESSFRLRGRLR